MHEQNRGWNEWVESLRDRRNEKKKEGETKEKEDVETGKKNEYEGKEVWVRKKGETKMYAREREREREE